MPKGLLRVHGGGNLHFITTSCYRREALLGTARARDIFLQIFEQVRRAYAFDVIGFVVMPEHIHILITEPQRKTVSIAMQVLKQRVARRRLPKRKSKSQSEFWERKPRRRFWQRRYYDFNVYSQRKTTEKLRYMHRNPVKRGLVLSPELWYWSSYRSFAFGEEGVVKLSWQTMNESACKGSATSIATHPRKQQHREGRAPTLWDTQKKQKRKVPSERMGHPANADTLHSSFCSMGGELIKYLEKSVPRIPENELAVFGDRDLLTVRRDRASSLESAACDSEQTCDTGRQEHYRTWFRTRLSRLNRRNIKSSSR